MRARTIHLSLFFVVLNVGAAVACGGGGGNDTGGGGGGGGGGGADGGGKGDGSADGTTTGSDDSGNGQGFNTVDAQPTVSSDAACAATASTAKLDPLNMIILLDRSKSMDDEGKWGTVTHALSGFLASSTSDGLGISLGYFPLDFVCSRPEYMTPAIALTILPTGRTNLTGNIAAQSPFVDTYGGTPMIQALEGALAYAKAQSLADPTRHNVVVMATDGYPEGCVEPDDGGAPNTLTDVVSLVQNAAITEPKVKTFVIGVGSLLTSLNGIAAAGDTGSAFLVDTVGTNTEALFRQALDSVRRQAAACDFAVPTTTMAIDFNDVNVVYKSSPTAADQYMGYVPTLADCVNVAAGAKAWYYDDPNHPTRVNLCPATCVAVQGVGATDGVVNVEFGCKRIDVK